MGKAKTLGELREAQELQKRFVAVVRGFVEGIGTAADCG